jgi:hypothetical protein
MDTDPSSCMDFESEWHILQSRVVVDRVPWIILAVQCVCILEKHTAGNPHAR